MRHAKRQQMAQHAADKRPEKKKRSPALISGLAAFCFAALLALAGYQLIAHPDTPLPRQWNPAQPLVISDPVTPFTQWKLGRTAEDYDQCLQALDGFVALRPLAPLEESAQCYINDRVSVSRVGNASLVPLETRCAIALRMALWLEHSVQPAAQEHLGQDVSQITQIGSYNCRPIRTVNGPSSRMSTHATADAVDIAGFALADGSRIRLLDDWSGAGAKSTFLHDVRDGACTWFSLTLSPDYNRLHADHFHLQSRGWGLCR